MKFPEELRYTKDHEWVRAEADGTTVTIGITDFAQSELGDIVYVELEPEDSVFEAEEVFGTVEAVKTVSELFMPVAGTVIQLNEELEDNPESVNDDPYGAGWMIKVRVDDKHAINELMNASDYSTMVSE